MNFICFCVLRGLIYFVIPDYPESDEGSRLRDFLADNLPAPL